MKYYVIKLLTNTQGQDGSEVTAVYQNEDPKIAKEKALVGYHQLCASLHNAPDVLYAVAKIENEFGNNEIMEIIDHRPAPAPEPTSDTESEE